MFNEIKDLYSLCVRINATVLGKGRVALFAGPINKSSINMR